MKAFESGSKRRYPPGTSNGIRRSPFGNFSIAAPSSVVDDQECARRCGAGRRTPRLLRTIGYKPVDHCIQFPSAAIGAIRRLTIRDRAVAVGKQLLQLTRRRRAPVRTTAERHWFFRRRAEARRRANGRCRADGGRAPIPRPIAATGSRAQARIDMRGLDDHALIAPAGQQLAATLHASLLAAVLSLRVAATLRSSSDRLRW
jgi:hypothetical protein